MTQDAVIANSCVFEHDRFYVPYAHCQSAAPNFLNSVLPSKTAVNAAAVITRARDAASPQPPCSARLRILTEASGVLNEIKNITELTVPILRTKLYVSAEKKPPEDRGIITDVKTLSCEAPSERALSSSDVLSAA